MIENGLKIMNINAAEILKVKEGREAEIKYNCVINNSLLLDKLKELGLKISKQNSTKQIVNVTFDYAYKQEDYNENVIAYNVAKKQHRKDISSVNKANRKLTELQKRLIRYGKEIIDLKSGLINADKKEKKSITNKIKTRKNKIEKTESEIKKMELMLEEKTILENKSNMEMLEKLKDAQNGIIKKQNLRNKLYAEGFTLDTYKTVNKEKIIDETIEYVFWFRTAGKAKNGADYFIDKRLYNKIKNWQSMGITLPKTDCKKVEMEVYKSLVSSAIENYYVCNPRTEILVVNDLDCYSKLQDVIKVYRDEITGYSRAEHTKQKCKNTIWDGMALIQTENGSTGFRGLRHHFYKTGAFIGDFQQYFKDYYGDKYENVTVTDRYGRKIKLCKVKMITTENAMKWEKFFDDKLEGFNQWCKYVEENGCKFGVCKRAHKSKYGSKQRMSYQMVNTLPLENGDIQKLFKDSKEYVEKLQNDNDFLINYMKQHKSYVNLNEMLLDIYNRNHGFFDSYLFRAEQYSIINEFKNNLKQGKILSEGDNETIVGNLFLLLEYVTGQLDKYIKNNVISNYIDKTLPNKDNCYCRRFKDKEKLGCFRSPHNSMNNIMVFENNKSEIMDKYFYCLGDNVIVVNFLYTDIQDRGNGLDTDTDFVLTTNNKTIVKACEKAQKYPTIINDFKKSNKKYNDTMEDLATIDNGLQASQKAIGTSSNVAQLYLSQYWDLKNNNIKDSVEKMLDNVCILSILAQVAVDSSKRTFEVGNLNSNALNKEIERLKKELPYKEKPMFWQYVSGAFKPTEIQKKLKSKNKDYWKSLSDKKKRQLIKEEKEKMIKGLYDYNCPANSILKEIDMISNKKYKKRIKDSKFIQLIGTNDTRNKKQAKKIEELVEEFTRKQNEIYNNVKDANQEEEANEYIKVIYKDLIKQIKKYTIKVDTMSLLIARALDADNKSLKNNTEIKRNLLNALYRSHKEEFLNCFLISSPQKSEKVA